MDLKTVQKYKKSTLSIYGDYNITNVTKQFPSELVLEKNNFHLMEMRTDKVALAQVIQNLIFFHKGNFPNQPELGVGIEDYLFEQASDETIANLRLVIEEQIKKFIPTDYTINFNLNLEKQTNNMTIISITFNIKNYDDMTDTEFTILYGRNQKNNKLISKLIA